MAFVRGLSALVVLALSGAALAQADDPVGPATVSWTAEAQAAKAGRAIVTLHGSITPGWHVYSLKQLPNGPTPLVVSVDSNAVAIVDGAATGTPATRLRDPAFGLETQFYADAFTVSVPVKLRRHAGGQAIPVSVRFQTCNGRVCQPPRTEHLSAVIKG